MTRTIPSSLEIGPGRYLLDEARRRRNQRIRDRYLLGQLPLACAIARRYAGAYGSEQELIQVANRGLVRAVREFELASGQPFAAFAETFIVSELEDHVQDLERSGAGVERVVSDDDAGAVEPALAAAVGRQPHVRDLAGFLHCDVDVLVEGLLTAIAREPHLVPSPAVREQPPALRRVG